MLTAESWRPVVGWPEYEISSEGRLRSLCCNGGRRRREPRILLGGRDRNGYRRAVLCLRGLRRSERIASLVAEAFIGPRPEGMVIRHLDGVNDHDAAANLAYGTQQENIADQERHGTRMRGETHPHHILTEQDVMAIRASAEPLRVLARRHGVAECTISAVRTRRNWRHV